MEVVTLWEISGYLLQVVQVLFGSNFRVRASIHLLLIFSVASSVGNVTTATLTYVELPQPSLIKYGGYPTDEVSEDNIQN